MVFKKPHNHKDKARQKAKEKARERAKEKAKEKALSHADEEFDTVQPAGALLDQDKEKEKEKADDNNAPSEETLAGFKVSGRRPAT